jgi:hypothetical protein
VGFVKEKFKIENEKLLNFLTKTFDLNEREAKKMVNRGRVGINGERLKYYNQNYSGVLDIIYFKPEPLGIKPIFEIEQFAVFDKPSGVAIHPKGFTHSQTLLDDVRFLYGKDANLAHRLDKETSGLVIASKNKWSEKIIKKMFPIKKQIIDEFEFIEYHLGVPNKEIQKSLNLLFFRELTDITNYLSIQKAILKAMVIKDIKEIETILTSLFASIPYNNFTNNNMQNYEGYYASVIYAYFASLGVDIIAEDVTNLGRIDLTLIVRDKIYIIEFKVGEENALNQIKQKEYHKKYISKDKEIILVGINFDKEKRNIYKMEFEEIK